MSYRPTIGKTVIETLTLGMYENPLIIYREYVQNAADAIDDAVEERILSRKSNGEINITIEKENRKIVIQDNATGIIADNALNFLGDVANSQKNSIKNKGFRGIGRLGGMGYCEQLIFETSAKGENVKTIITLDASRLKKIIENDADTRDAAAVMSVITYLEKVNEERDAHYFKVTLQGVTNEKLLIHKNVNDYLSLAAPVPFSDNFAFKDKIYKEFKKRNFFLDEYDVHLTINDNSKLHKPYRNQLLTKVGSKPVDIIDVEIFEITDEKGEVIALGWFSVTTISNFKIDKQYIERSLRLRHKNIQLGDGSALDRFFTKDSRFNNHYVGEVHAIADEFRPNARRDYFNDNAIVSQFEGQLQIVLDDLNDLSHDSSAIHVFIKKTTDYNSAKASFDKNREENKYSSQAQENEQWNQVENFRKEAVVAKEKLEKVLNKSDNRLAKKIYDTKSKDLKIDLDSSDRPTTKRYPKPDLPLLNEKQKIVVIEIFKILRKELGINQAEKLIKIIIEKYSY